MPCVKTAVCTSCARGTQVFTLQETCRRPVPLRSRGRMITGSTRRGDDAAPPPPVAGSAPRRTVTPSPAVRRIPSARPPPARERPPPPPRPKSLARETFRGSCRSFRARLAPARGLPAPARRAQRSLHQANRRPNRRPCRNDSPLRSIASPGPARRGQEPRRVVGCVFCRPGNAYYSTIVPCLIAPLGIPGGDLFNESTSAALALVMVPDTMSASIQATCALNPVSISPKASHSRRAVPDISIYQRPWLLRSLSTSAPSESTIHTMSSSLGSLTKEAPLSDHRSPRSTPVTVGATIFSIDAWNLRESSIPNLVRVNAATVLTRRDSRSSASTNRRTTGLTDGDTESTIPSARRARTAAR